MLQKNHRQLLINLAIKAGEATMQFFRKDFDVNYKIDDSPVTLADLEANRIILDGLAQTGLAVISEESENLGYEQRKNLKEFWIVDPLDGTKQFVKGENEFTVNIALIMDNYSVEGVVFAPAKSLLYYGADYYGAERYNLKTGEIVKLNCTKSVCDKLNVVASKSHLNELTKSFLNKLENHFGYFKIVNAGSSLKFCSVAEGSANLYPRLGAINEWDIAAGHAVLKAAGGSVVSLENGLELNYNSETLKTPDYIAINDMNYLKDFLNYYHELKTEVKIF